MRGGRVREGGEVELQNVVVEFADFCRRMIRHMCDHNLLHTHFAQNPSASRIEVHPLHLTVQHLSPLHTHNSPATTIPPVQQRPLPQKPTIPSDTYLPRAMFWHHCSSAALPVFFAVVDAVVDCSVLRTRVVALCD